ncbi:MAG: stimulus-sensing domain-containing protein [Alphaproteobacteria bacterium]|nr:stimulus-sensing domain-containing protein [Alphaproteobacteria bacterium]
MAIDAGTAGRVVAPETEPRTARVAASAPVADDHVAAPPKEQPRHARRPRISPLIRPILSINLLALVLLGAGLFFLDDYEKELINSEISSLYTQAIIIAGALGESAVVGSGYEQELDEEVAGGLIRRLVEGRNLRARLFDVQKQLVADSQLLVGGPGGTIVVQDLPPPDTRNSFKAFWFGVYDWVLGALPARRRYPRYVERWNQTADDFEEAEASLAGDHADMVRDGGEGDLILSAAVPVQRYRRVMGALMLTRDGGEIQRGVRAVRFDILKVFFIALGVTVLLSIYLASTLARPVRRLAAAADQVRTGKGRTGDAIPDFTSRGDEIGDLSEALRDMTEALWQRMDAIERFAADVSHEIKNPLTSLRSAVETAARVEDPEQQRRLLAIILDDVQRLDRLITDISDASRLDAELSRAESAPVDVGQMLITLVEVHGPMMEEGGPRLALEISDPESLDVMGMEDRLVQVFRNLITNAISFSPPGGEIRLSVRRDGRWVVVEVSDEGPGVPEDKKEAIFERFYSERPSGEKFGTHSGLGLSISNQIVDAHRGRIMAENRRDRHGNVLGARFRVLLPAD